MRKVRTASVSFGPRQLAIMERLWSVGAQTPVELHRALGGDESVAYTTIFTELSRLVQKGAIGKSAGEHKSVVYEPTFTRAQWVASTVSNILSDLIASHGSAAIHGFVDVVADAQAMDDLRDAIDRRGDR